MRQLTAEENQAMIRAYKIISPPNTKRGFEAGFAAGLDYQQYKLDAYAAYVGGKITQQELEEILNTPNPKDSVMSIWTGEAFKKLQLG